MNTNETWTTQINSLVARHGDLLKLAMDKDKVEDFGREYAAWYAQAMKLIESIAPEKAREFEHSYKIDPNRKMFIRAHYVIEDYIQGTPARKDENGKPTWDVHSVVQHHLALQVDTLRALTAPR